MQKRVTMHLRNNRLLFVVVAIFFFNLGSWAQASGAQNTAPANPTPAPTTPSQPQTQQSAPVQSARPNPARRSQHRPSLRRSLSPVRLNRLLRNQARLNLRKDHHPP